MTRIYFIVADSKTDGENLNWFIEANHSIEAVMLFKQAVRHYLDIDQDERVEDHVDIRHCLIVPELTGRPRVIPWYNDNGLKEATL